MDAFKLKKVLTDPSFWILLIANVFLVYKYEQNPKIFTTLIWLYWSQNILYGFFNFIDILTTRKVDISTGVKSPFGSQYTEKGIKSSTAWFFFFHFGAFHLAYFIFLLAMDKTGPFDWSFFKYYLLVFFIFQLVSFIQNKIRNKDNVTNLGRMFFKPYLRVVPMHLCILIPAFLHITSLTVFLILKVIADVFMYVITNSSYKRNPIAEITAMNIKSTISPD
jgi:hypothetical protein